MEKVHFGQQHFYVGQQAAGALERGEFVTFHVEFQQHPIRGGHSMREQFVQRRRRPPACLCFVFFIP